MRSADQILSTNGNNLWSNKCVDVRVTGLDLAYEADLEGDETECQFGELRVYFDTKTWDIDRHGLIYTDKGFMRELHDYLTRAGYDASDVSYSEQGMQGDNYVSCDVGPMFIRSWKAK